MTGGEQGEQINPKATKRGGIVDALIGNTGFIGSELTRHHDFGATFNSKTIGTIGQSHYQTIVCAAAPGSMMEANRMPDQDASRIDALIDSLRSVAASDFVLISTIAVLRGFSAENEDTAEFETNIAYGVNRRRLEAFVLEHFERPLVIRLPALFGGVLRKNFLFDILNPVPSMLSAEKLDSTKKDLEAELAAIVDRIYRWDTGLSLYLVDRAALDASERRADLETAVEAIGGSALQFTNPASHFQFYDIGRLWSDIGKGMKAGLRVLHLSPVPLAAADVFRAVRGAEMAPTSARVHGEDMRTTHADLWGRGGSYSADADQVIAGIRRYFERVRAA